MPGANVDQAHRARMEQQTEAASTQIRKDEEEGKPGSSDTADVCVAAVYSV